MCFVGLCNDVSLPLSERVIERLGSNWLVYMRILECLPRHGLLCFYESQTTINEGVSVSRSILVFVVSNNDMSVAL
jgi:hypothetical protein